MSDEIKIKKKRKKKRQPKIIQITTDQMDFWGHVGTWSILIVVVIGVLLQIVDMVK